MQNLPLREPSAREISQMEPQEKLDAAQDEFEIVLGIRQLAGLLFVAIVILVVFSAFLYLAGKKAASPQKAASTPPPETVLTATVTRAADPQPPVPLNSAPEPPIFADPAIGAVYLQMGAVDKGIAVIFAEGLRKRGFDAFAAPGPSEKIFRVLIGPLPNPEAYTRAKDALDAIGVNAFARKYQEEAGHPSGPALVDGAGLSVHVIH